MVYERPVLLTSHHVLEEFTCRSPAQTAWIRRHGRQSAQQGTTRVLVVTAVGHDEVVAYYAWCMAQVHADTAPSRLLKGAGRYPPPVALLARLGVDTRHEGHGLGAALLTDALARLMGLSEEIGCRGLMVHAESDEARRCYLHLVPEFESSPLDPLDLVLMMKDIRHSLRVSAGRTE